MAERAIETLSPSNREIGAAVGVGMALSARLGDGNGSFRAV